MFHYYRSVLRNLNHAEPKYSMLSMGLNWSHQIQKWHLVTITVNRGDEKWWASFRNSKAILLGLKIIFPFANCWFARSGTVVYHCVSPVKSTVPDISDVWWRHDWPRTRRTDDRRPHSGEWDTWSLDHYTGSDTFSVTTTNTALLSSHQRSNILTIRYRLTPHSSPSRPQENILALSLLRTADGGGLIQMDNMDLFPRKTS